MGMKLARESRPIDEEPKRDRQLETRQYEVSTSDSERTICWEELYL